MQPAVDAAWAQDARATAVHPHSKAVIVGQDAVRKSWEGAFADVPEPPVSMPEPQVRISGMTAIVAGVEIVKGKGPSGDVVDFQAMTTNEYELKDGRWLMVHHRATRVP